MADLARILPYILGAAVSPVLLVTTLYLLSLKQQPIKKTLLYLLSATATIAAIIFLIFYSTNINPVAAPGRDLLPHVIIGVLLIGLAYNIYRKGPAKADKKPDTGHGIARYLLLGVGLMLVNFTTIAMIFEIAIELRANHIQGLGKTAYMIATIVSSIFPIILPLLILWLAGKNSKSILEVLSNFMQKYSHTVTAVFFGVLGVFSLLKPFI